MSARKECEQSPPVGNCWWTAKRKKDGALFSSMTGHAAFEVWRRYLAGYGSFDEFEMIMGEDVPVSFSPVPMTTDAEHGRL